MSRQLLSYGALHRAFLDCRLISTPERYNTNSRYNSDGAMSQNFFEEFSGRLGSKPNGAVIFPLRACLPGPAVGSAGSQTGIVAVSSGLLAMRAEFAVRNAKKI
ncbi:MAG: hypothetical protein HN478_13405 [Rhodospirillaceae bacterium]|jgi:hypothetical protein|nr:hypothetical protein [Rhodospirillaceae bacterium]